MSAVWTLGSLADAAGGVLSGADPATEVTGLSIDTRTLAAGEVYFAIKGVSMDGHRFVPAAYEAGAVAAVVSQPVDGPAITVDEPLRSMERAASVARARLAPGVPVVAVTGSVGKTGTKEMLRLAFGAGGSVHASTASFNNHWGVPLSVARMPAQSDAAIFEIGMNHAGEITPLTKLARPTVAIVTTVGPVHLEFFESVAAIADAKAEIFLGLEPGGTAIVPADNEHSERLIAAAEAVGARVMTFGTDDADVALTAVDADGRLEARVGDEAVRFAMGAVGPHIQRNALAVLAALKVAGRNVAAGAAELARWAPAKGRGRVVRLGVPGGEAVLLDDAYNANPTSMAAAIATLGRTPATRRVVILGDMRELGEDSAALHRGLAPHLAEAHVRIVHTVGPMSHELRQSLPETMRGEHFAAAADALAALPAVLPGDAVLVKASLGTGLSPVVAALEERYPSPEISTGEADV